MKRFLTYLQCMWFGHSYKITWGRNRETYVPFLETMECSRCGKKINIEYHVD